MNAKKSLSSCQLARDLEMNQGTAWYLMQRVRAAMAADQGPQGRFLRKLRGIVESDDTYIGSKLRKSDERRKPRKRRKPGRGTTKTPVLGVVERGGRVRAMVVGPESPVSDLTGRTILRFIKNSVDPGPESPSLGSVLISDEYPPYRVIGRFRPHQAINHQERYGDRSGGHTNTIDP